MKITVLAFVVCCLAIEWPWEDGEDSSSVQSSVTTVQSGSVEFTKTIRTYAPTSTKCPSGSIVREASSLHSSEKDYMARRHEQTNENLAAFLSDRARLSNFDAQAFIEKTKNLHNITIGLAFSGGGYRAMFSGAGELLALDDRYEYLNKSGLGGLLQSSSYITGLSGGSWLVGTLVLNDWMTVEEAILPDSGIWELENLIFNPSGINVFLTLKYYQSLRTAVEGKANAGFETSITDVWGRALSYQFFNPDTTYNGGENITWTSIRALSHFKNQLMPFPIIVANGRSPGTLIVNENSTVFEFTPYELGSWDPSLNSFVDLNFLGTTLDNGRPKNNTCYTNFDNAGFVMGTLSSLFNQALLRVQSSSTLNWAVKKLLTLILSPFSENNVDIATYKPNPFFNGEFGASETIASDETLHLVDGGEDMQNVPLYPLIQKERKVDVIFAYDNSADVHNWPNGSSLVYTYERQFSPQGKGTPFPYVPSVEEFMTLDLFGKPVFFGCDASNLTDLVGYHELEGNSTDVPLVIYIPNLYHLFESNTSTYEMSYSPKEIHKFIENGFEVSSRGNYSQDRKWPTCVGCAIIRRQQERLGEEQSEECKDCFANYCWTGGLEDSPQRSIGPFKSADLTLASSAASKISSKSDSNFSSSSTDSTPDSSSGLSTSRTANTNSQSSDSRLSSLRINGSQGKRMGKYIYVLALFANMAM